MMKNSIYTLTLSLLFMILVVDCLSAEAKDPNRYVWDLSPLYVDEAAWEKERDHVMREIDAISRLKGNVATDARGLLTALNRVSDLRARAGKLAIYGFLVSDTDTSSELARRQYEVGTGLESQVESAVSFVAVEVRDAGKEKVNKWLEEEPALERYRARLNRIFVEAPYSPPSDALAVIESAARWPRLSADLFGELHNADLGWPIVNTQSGESKTLNRSAYFALRRQINSHLRSEEMEKYLKSLARLENVFGLLYTRRIEADLILAKHRGFKNGMDAIWFLRDGMPPGTHKTMLDVTRKNMAVFQRFARLRAEIEGSDQPSYSDLFSPPAGTPAQLPLEDAMNITLAVSEPLGQEFTTILKKRMEQPWMHLAESPNKSGTYAIWPPVGGAPPFVIMQYDGSYDSGRRFTGAMMLMMSFAEWGATNAPDSRDDPGIYSNGIIYVGDILYDDYRREHAANKQERVAFLIQSLDFLRHHYFHWVLNSEFDRRVQDRIMQGDIPDGGRLSEIYLQILREFYGHDAGGIDVAEQYGREWMLNSVPFLSYEHQFWPAAVAAASNIVEGLRQGDNNARKAVYQVLGRSPSDRTHGLLLQAGIDLSKPDPYRAVIERAERLLAELEKLSNPSSK